MCAHSRTHDDPLQALFVRARSHMLSFAAMTKPVTRRIGEFDVLAVRDEIMDYLAEHSGERQEIIADLVGMRRERICAYSKRRSGLTHVVHVQKLYEWMQADRRNGQQFDADQIQALVTLARQNLKKATNREDTEKWARKLEKYRRLMPAN